MKNVKAISLSAIISMAALTLIIIVGELSEPFKAGLKALTYHHWVTKSVITIILYVVLWLILSRVIKVDNEKSGKYIWWILGATIISSTVILFFYTLHHLTFV